MKKNVPAILFILVNMSIALYFFCNRNNPTLSDLIGHFSSAKFFSQGYFHSYNDFQFLGIVQNLFYPPLQDVIISIISFFTSKNFVLAGTIYISLMYLCYLFSIVYMSKVIKNNVIQSVFLILVTLWLMLEKNTGIGIGLSFFDLMDTGLSTQFLGSIFLFILIRQVIENKNYLQVGFLIAISFLAHIFVGLLAFSLVLGYSFRNKKYLISFLLALGMSAVCWLPFAANSNYIISYSIYDSAKTRLTLFSILSAVLFLLMIYRKQKSFYWQWFPKHFSILLIGAFCIFILNIVGGEDYYLHFFNLKSPNFHLPKFHYYRLVVYAYLFLLLEFCLYSEQYFTGIKNKCLFFAFAAGIVIYFNYNGAVFFRKDNFLSLQVKSNIMSPSGSTSGLDDNKNYSRAYFVPNSSPSLLYFGQYLQALFPTNFKSSQGLYWESSKSSFLLSSYNSSLFHDHSGVIDYTWQTPSSCPVEACYLDQFFRDFNIGTFGLDPTLQSNYLASFQKMCLQQAIENGKTGKNIFNYKGSIEINYPQISKNMNINVYAVSQTSPTVYNNNSPLEIISPNAIVKNYDPNQPFYFGEYFTITNSYCENKVKDDKTEFNTLFLPIQFKNVNFSFHNSIEPLSMSQINFEKIEKNKYKIVVDSKKPVWFKIKLSWFPGFKLGDKNGKILPLYQGIGYMLGYGQGEMSLVYERSGVFYIAYFISILSFIFAMYCMIIRYFKRNSAKVP